LRIGGELCRLPFYTLPRRDSGLLVGTFELGNGEFGKNYADVRVLAIQCFPFRVLGDGRTVRSDGFVAHSDECGEQGRV
jgi:hypothetical protein